MEENKNPSDDTFAGVLVNSMATSTIIIDMNDFDDECDASASGLSTDLVHSNEEFSHATHQSVVDQQSKDKSLLAKFNGYSGNHKRRKGKYDGILPKEKPFICPFVGCGKVLQDRLKLRNHYSNHQERRHVCQYCGQKFLYLKDKRIHERTHTGERPFVCQVCNKAFVQKCTLSNHLTTHSNNAKGEICNVCGRAYYYKKTLAQHKKEKHGNLFDKELFACPLCGKKYLGNYWYNIHLKKCKNKEDTCKCELCGEQFQKQTLLKKHKNSCPQRHVYQCGVCNIILRTEGELREHMQGVHNIGFDDCLQVQLVERFNKDTVDVSTMNVSESTSGQTEILLNSNLNLSHEKLNVTENPT